MGNVKSLAPLAAITLLLSGCASTDPSPPTALPADGTRSLGTGVATSSPNGPSIEPATSAARVAPPASSSATSGGDGSTGPLHLAITASSPPSFLAVSGGPAILMGSSFSVFDPAKGAFVARPDLDAGFDKSVTFGDLVGNVDGELWFAGSGPHSHILRRSRGAEWKSVATVDAQVHLLPLGEGSVIARVHQGDSFLRFEVFGDPPLRAAPQVPVSTSPCKLHLDGVGFVTLSDGTIVAGDACYAIWGPKAVKATVKRELGGAVVRLKGEGGTSILAFGNVMGPLSPVLATGDGQHWTLIDISKLPPKTMLKDAARSGDGTVWVVGEREGEPAMLMKKAAHGKEWERVPVVMGGRDPDAARHTDVLSIESVDGEVWVEAQHALRIEGPYTTALFTTRAVKQVLTL